VRDTNIDDHGPIFISGDAPYVNHQKSPIYSQKSPIYIQKRPMYIQKRPMFISGDTPYVNHKDRSWCHRVDDTCVAVCCSVLQCVAVCCSVLQCVAVCCSVSKSHTHTHHPQ